MKSPGTERFDVLIIGSGPAGAAVARVIKDARPEANVLVVESGPLITWPPGRHVKTIADENERQAAQIASQGPDDALRRPFSAVARAELRARGVPELEARPGTWLLGPGAVCDGEDGMPAAALSSNVGGMGAHWTCACPTPGGAEVTPLLSRDTLTGELSAARALLHVKSNAFAGAPLGDEVRMMLARRYDRHRPPDRRVQPMPLAIEVDEAGARHWVAPDVIFGGLTITPADGFALRPSTTALAVDATDEGVVVDVHDTANNRRYAVAARFAVLACDALRTPQLLFASGIRPGALGHYLNDQPQVTGTVMLSENLRPGFADSSGAAAEEGTVDALSGVSWIPYTEEFPFHGQIMQRDTSPVPLADGVEPWPGAIVECGLFAACEPLYGNRVEFDEDNLDSFGLPSIRIHYTLTDAVHASIASMIAEVNVLADTLGSYVNATGAYVHPAGSSLHYQGTVRMGAVDDGTSVCDPRGRVWGARSVYVAGNGVIPTATACNPTLTNVAFAAHSARDIVARLA